MEPETVFRRLGPLVAVVLTERQWDIVRDALVQRGTKQADEMREKIWQQGGGTRYDGKDSAYSKGKRDE